MYKWRSAYKIHVIINFITYPEAIHLTIAGKREREREWRHHTERASEKYNKVCSFCPENKCKHWRKLLYHIIEQFLCAIKKSFQINSWKSVYDKDNAHCHCTVKSAHTTHPHTLIHNTLAHQETKRTKRISNGSIREMLFSFRHTAHSLSLPSFS